MKSRVEMLPLEIFVNFCLLLRIGRIPVFIHLKFSAHVSRNAYAKTIKVKKVKKRLNIKVSYLYCSTERAIPFSKLKTVVLYNRNLFERINLFKFWSILLEILQIYDLLFERYVTHFEKYV